MPNLTNPSDIARETLKQLATRRIPPTPENYRQIYHEIADIPLASDSGVVHALTAALRELEQNQSTSAPAITALRQAIDAQDWPTFARQLNTALSRTSNVENQDWAKLIRELIKQWELKQNNLTASHKKEALERVLINFGKSADTLYEKMLGLIKAWGDGVAGPPDIDVNEIEPVASEPSPPDRPDDCVVAPVGPLNSRKDIPHLLSELLAQAMLNGVMPRIARFPELATRAETLARQARDTTDIDSYNRLSKDIRQFWIELELRANADQEVLDGLMRLLRLLIDNITELLLDDQWLRGQLTIVQDVLNAPLSPRIINEAEKRFKEVIFKQGSLKHSLNEAKLSLKNLVTIFISRIGEMSTSTGEYHLKIEDYAQLLGQTDDLPSINKILQDIIADTRHIHLDMLRSHDDLMNARRQAEAAEERMRKLEEELGEVSELIYQDHLTGTLNRRGMEEAFAREFARSERSKLPVSIALLDVDHFKRLNDTYGHDAGDQALVHLAGIIKDILRPVDIVARFGGEEFVIILPDTSQDDGLKVMIRLQRELTKRFFLHDNEKVLITFSAGVAERTAAETVDAIIARADAALYRAKQSGRNRVYLA